MEAKETETIDAVVLDALMYGMAKALDYLGPQGQVILNKIGEEILNYLVEKGEIKLGDNLMQTFAQLSVYFRKLSFLAEGNLEIKGDTMTVVAKPYQWSAFATQQALLSKGCHFLACPACLASIAAAKKMGLDSEESELEFISDGSIARSYRLIGPKTGKPLILPFGARVFLRLGSLIGKITYGLGIGKAKEKKPIDLAVFRVVIYGMAKALDYLGAQGQVLLDRMGEEIVNYLVEKGEIQRNEDPFKTIGQLKEFFKLHGVVDDVEIELQGENVSMKGKNWRFFNIFFQDIAKEGYPLISCPILIASRAVMREAGYALEFTGIEPLDPEKRIVIGKGRIIDLKKERFTEAMAEKMKVKSTI